MGSSSNPPALQNVFVYGSLLANEVVQVILKRVPASAPAILNGLSPICNQLPLAFPLKSMENFLSLRDWLSISFFHLFCANNILPPCCIMVEDNDENVIKSRRFSIKGRVYPAILPVDNKKVIGKVLLGITAPELSILDAFEDTEYKRHTVEVSLMDGSQKLPVYAYVWSDSTDPNLYGDWNFEEWREKHMNDFVKMTLGFMEEQKLPESKPRAATYESFYKQSGDNSDMP